MATVDSYSAAAEAQLEAINTINGGSIEIREGTAITDTLIATFNLADPAFAALTTVGSNKVLAFAGLPIEATAVASSGDNTTPLYAYVKNAGGTGVLRGLVTTQADGSGFALVDAAGHSALPSKPIILENNVLEITTLAQITKPFIS